MFTKALIATDSSPASLSLVGCVGALRLLGVQECVLAQCFQIREYVPFPDQIKAHIEAALTRQKRILEAHGVRTVVAVEPGWTSVELPRIAAERHCSLLVVGSHGHDLTHDIFLGSTASELLHQTTLPLLMIRLKTDDKTGRTMVVGKGRDFRRHILYATDFSEHAKLAFDYLFKLVEGGARRVTLLHVQDKVKLGGHLENRMDEFNRIDRRRLEEMKKRLKTADEVRVGMEISYGAPAEEILKRTVSAKPSLVIMGSHGRGYVSELFMGSTSHNIARHSKVPLLLIPRRRTEK